jgi:hypothetical protein
MMMESWGDAFDFDAWVKSVSERLESQAEEIASLLIKVNDLEQSMSSQAFIGTPPAGAFIPRNRRFNA